MRELARGGLHEVAEIFEGELQLPLPDADPFVGRLTANAAFDGEQLLDRVPNGTAIAGCWQRTGFPPLVNGNLRHATR